MKRISLSPIDARLYFDSLKRSSGISFSYLSTIFGVSSRTLRAWREGKYSFPLQFSEWATIHHNVSLPKDMKIVDVSEVKSYFGRKGAFIRNKKYGNPGTIVGRKKGGINSLVTHKMKQTGFRVLKIFPTVIESAKLAEFIGIMLGDGGMTDTQVRVTLSFRDDQLYAHHVRDLMYELFNEKPKIFQQEPRGTIEVILSGKNLVRQLNAKGLVIGNKIEQQIGLPPWVSKNTEMTLSALRGLFDTDGSIYLDSHHSKTKHYGSACIAYTTYSARLYDDICQKLATLGFFPTFSTKNRIVLRKRQEVKKFFTVVRPANQKHLQRYKKFMDE